LWRTLNLLPKPEAALSGASCGGRVGPDGSFFPHPFFGALIKKGMRLWVINHYNGFVMHGLIPNCFYTNQGRRPQCKTGPQRRGEAVQEGLSGAGCPSRTAKNIKKQKTSPRGAFRGLGARLRPGNKQPERPQSWECLRCLQDGPANERCLQGDVAELRKTVCPPRFAQATPQKTDKNIAQNTPWGSFLKLRGASPAGPCFWRTINLPSKTEPALLGASGGVRAGPVCSLFRAVFLKHFLEPLFAARFTFLYGFWTPFRSPAGYPGPLRSV
jgi:hypothetical protein